jgi:hypothetical protein
LIRFPEKWAYFGLGRNAESARAIPKTESCFTCHSANAAVENTFAQFYPTVFAVAKEREPESRIPQSVEEPRNCGSAFVGR